MLYRHKAWIARRLKKRPTKLDRLIAKRMAENPKLKEAVERIKAHRVQGPLR